MKRVGIVGVGLLGGAVASRLLQAKFEIKGYDIRPEQLKRLEPHGLIDITPAYRILSRPE
ncbi:MAG: NAD(P)-binding domain-containing protein [Candidatus Binatia bacterium]